MKYFIKISFPNVSNENLLYLISKCEGSFLYAYYLVNELKQGGQGFEPMSNDYISKGIAGFYHKQFTRLKTDLQRFKPNESSSILKSFRNVIAASKEPLPCKILFTCMGLSGEDFEVREMIIGIISEILPIYDNCLTVYHKSLWDWLTLNGYEEHAFVADIDDGKYRIWRACENVYRDIISLRCISDFQISPETSYALRIGEEFLLDIGGSEDFHWLVNVRLNFLKLQLGKELKFSSIFAFYKSKHSNYHCWGNIHIRAFLSIYNSLRNPVYNFMHHLLETPDWPYLYLQSLANGYFDFAQKAISGENEARDILDLTNQVWVEEVGNDYIPENKIISHAIIGDNKFHLKLYDAFAISPDNKFIAHKEGARIEVFGLPNLSMFCALERDDFHKESKYLQFSPDASYLVWNSARSCLSLTSQMEVPLIPHGPENVDCVSFSPCGMRLVTCEKETIKLWNVNSKSMLAQIKTDFRVKYSIFSNCNSFIFATILPQRTNFSETFYLNGVVTFSSKTLERLDNENLSCPNCCLTKEDDYQIISPPHVSPWSVLTSNASLRIRHFHGPNGKIVLISNKYCSNPFEWKDKKCLIVLISRLSPLIFYDFINQEVVDVFYIDDLPTQSSLDCISKLDGSNFLVALGDNQVFVLSLEASTEPCERETRFVSASDIKCYALSPDNSYIACCSEGLILTIINVNNGKTLQTVELKHRPEACWWSEFYLWVICNAMVVKYSYNLAQAEVLGNEIEECSINFESVVVFMKGVLVIRPSDNTGICMRKICDENLYSQQIPDSNFSASSASVSSDGCAVLLYSKSSKDYQLWEIAGEHRWELRSSGVLDKYDQMAWYCLTGKENFRTSVWLTYMFTSFDDFNEPLALSSTDFVTGTKSYIRELPLQHGIRQVIYVNSKTFILHKYDWMYLIKVENGEIMTSLYIGSLLMGFQIRVASFFLASRGLLLLGGTRSIKIFRIRNIEKFLPDLIED